MSLSNSVALLGSAFAVAFVCGFGVVKLNVRRRRGRIPKVTAYEAHIYGTDRTVVASGRFSELPWSPGDAYSKLIRVSFNGKWHVLIITSMQSDQGWTAASYNAYIKDRRYVS